MKNIIFGLCMFVGFMIILGTAGSSDLGLIECNKILVQSFIGVGVMGVGYLGLRLTGADF